MSSRISAFERPAVPAKKPASDDVKPPKADDDIAKPDKSKAEKSGELTKGSGKSGDQIKLN